MSTRVFIAAGPLSTNASKSSYSQAGRPSVGCSGSYIAGRANRAR